jgi:hypothetical protein
MLSLKIAVNAEIIHLQGSIGTVGKGRFACPMAISADL